MISKSQDRADRRERKCARTRRERIFKAYRQSSVSALLSQVAEQSAEAVQRQREREMEKVVEAARWRKTAIEQHKKGSVIVPPAVPFERSVNATGRQVFSAAGAVHHVRI